MAKKSVTIDSLAMMVQKGFTGVDKKFEEVYNRFDMLDKRLDRIENVLLEQHAERMRL